MKISEIEITGNKKRNIRGPRQIRRIQNDFTQRDVMDKLKADPLDEASDVKGSVWEPKNIKSYEDAIDPEVLVHGVSRMLYSQLQDNLKRKSIDITRMIEEKDFDQINARMELFHHFLDAASDITKQMNSPAYKARITKLKNKEEYGVM
jgi:hypothetical protein